MSADVCSSRFITVTPFLHVVISNTFLHLLKRLVPPNAGVKGFSYKLRMMGIPVEDPTFIFGDNKSVIDNTTMTESTLKKKKKSIAYHFVQEGCDRDEWRTAYISTHENVAVILRAPLATASLLMLYDIIWCFFLN